MNRILVINGSYRKGGMTDQVVEVMAAALDSSGTQVETIHLRDYPIEFCLNCRSCTQQPGHDPGECVIHDGMQDLIRHIEASDGYILASPTNFGSVTAIFMRFMERLMGYAYWPWDQNAPLYRKANGDRKKAVLVSSSAAPAFWGRWSYTTCKQLKTTARTLGAGTVGVLFTGLVGKHPLPGLSGRTKDKARALATKLT